MAETYYLVTQNNTTQGLDIRKIDRARVFSTAYKRAFELVPMGTSAFLVIEEQQMNKLADDMKKIIRSQE